MEDEGTETQSFVIKILVFSNLRPLLHLIYSMGIMIFTHSPLKNEGNTKFYLWSSSFDSDIIGATVSELHTSDSGVSGLSEALSE